MGLLDDKVTSLNNRVSNLEGKVDDFQVGQNPIEKKLDAVYEQTDDLTEFRTSTTSNLTNIRKNVGFIKHKMHQNEKEIF